MDQQSPAVVPANEGMERGTQSPGMQARDGTLTRRVPQPQPGADDAPVSVAVLRTKEPRERDPAEGVGARRAQSRGSRPLPCPKSQTTDRLFYLPNNFVMLTMACPEKSGTAPHPTSEQLHDELPWYFKHSVPANLSVNSMFCIT